MSNLGMVYAISDSNGYVKIGRTDGASEVRLRTFQTGNVAPLRLLAECADDDPATTERHFHHCLRNVGLGARGEWFSPSPHLTVIISLMANDMLSEAAQYAMNMRGYVGCNRCTGEYGSRSCGHRGGRGCLIYEERRLEGYGVCTNERVP